jgi:hypothetical protein
LRREAVFRWPETPLRWRPVSVRLPLLLSVPCLRHECARLRQGAACADAHPRRR